MTVIHTEGRLQRNQVLIFFVKCVFAHIGITMTSVFHGFIGGHFSSWCVQPKCACMPWRNQAFWPVKWSIQNKMGTLILKLVIRIYFFQSTTYSDLLTPWHCGGADWILAIYIACRVTGVIQFVSHRRRLPRPAFAQRGGSQHRPLSTAAGMHWGQLQCWPQCRWPSHPESLDTYP